jgi:hypothetical protein
MWPLRAPSDLTANDASGQLEDRPSWLIKKLCGTKNFSGWRTDERYLNGNSNKSEVCNPPFSMLLWAKCMYDSSHMYKWASTALKTHLSFTIIPDRGRDNAVGTAIRYRLDGPGIKLRRRRDFSYPPRPALGTTQPPMQWYRDFAGRKAAETWCWPPNHI